jgi:hypothetical protein
VLVLTYIDDPLLIGDEIAKEYMQVVQEYEQERHHPGNKSILITASS